MQTKRRQIRRGGYIIMSAIAVALMMPSIAQAQLTLSITPTPIIVAPGQTITFSALLTNTGGVSLDLTNSFGTFVGPGLNGITWDDTTFLNNLPLALASGGTYQENLIATVIGSADPGLYVGEYTVEGTDAMNVTYSGVGQVNATVSAAIPEPSTLLLCGMGIAGGSFYRRRKQQ
jgi:PEP-CTERM motif